MTTPTPTTTTTTPTTTGPTSTGSVRPVDRVIAASRTIEGGGFEVFRPFPTADLDLLDPFLLLDEMAPSHHEPGEAIGAPPHPHRGFETVTYVLRGEVEHRDSAGNHGLIGPGDVQWMTAGDGIVHSELPSERIQTEGGVGHGLQLWVNLPSSLRRTQPRYQALPSDRISTASGEGWRAHVVSGSFFGVDGPADTHTPVGVVRLTIEPGAAVQIPVADGHTAAVYAFEGSGRLGADAHWLPTNHLGVFERTDGDILVSVPDDEDRPLDALVLTGEPIGEPIARYGPFVMNTRAEIEEAIADFQAGRMGSIPAVGDA